MKFALKLVRFALEFALKLVKFALKFALKLVRFALKFNKICMDLVSIVLARVRLIDT